MVQGIEAENRLPISLIHSRHPREDTPEYRKNLLNHALGALKKLHSLEKDDNKAAILMKIILWLSEGVGAWLVLSHVVMPFFTGESAYADTK